MKRLVVCCDGTWNRPDHVDRGVAAPTNVAKVGLALSDLDDVGNRQLLHYQAGVGTRRHERLLGGGLGVGLSRNVCECYRFLVENYEAGDELYFFGFSRGAFTARSTVGLVRNAGILRPEHRNRIDEAYALYRNPDRDSEPGGIAAELFRRSYSHADVFVDFVGVWDTVGALGIPIDGFRPPLLSRLWTFHDTKLSRYVRHAYHAIAIDERRRPFRPTLWEQQDGAEDQTLEQVWFAGVHCDIGGGYGDPSLSEIALLWMVEKATECGLAFKAGHFDARTPGSDPQQRRAGIVVAPDPCGDLHDSRTRFYRLLPAYDRRLAGDHGKDVDGGSLASSARTRHDEDAGYRPPGLDTWLAAGRNITQVRDGRGDEPASRRMPRRPLPEASPSRGEGPAPSPPS
jgi:uncharacterized protein (DUF2235 family)